MKENNLSVKPLMLTCILLLFASCGGGKTNDQEQIELYPNPPFNVTDAYSQKWVAGVPDGGSGTNVHLTLVDFSRHVTIDKVYFREQVTKAQISPQVKNQFVGYFRNDNWQDVIMDIDPVKEAKNTPKIPFPFELKDDEAVISFLDGNFVRYTKITNIREEEMLALPTVKPNNEN